MIFTIYITTLVVVPCSDLDNHCQEETNLADNAEHNHDHDSDDTCTPFCCCTCCGVQITFMNYQLSKIETEQTQEHISEKVAIEYISSHSTYFGEIWQPPQINA